VLGFGCGRSGIFYRSCRYKSASRDFFLWCVSCLNALSSSATECGQRIRWLPLRNEIRHRLIQIAGTVRYTYMYMIHKKYIRFNSTGNVIV
jgi:hypothetical protein